MFDDNEDSPLRHPLLGPRLRALQMFQMIDSIAQQRQARELQQQAFERQNANDDWLHNRADRLDQQAQANQDRDDIGNILAAGGRKIQPGMFSQFLEPRAVQIGGERYTRPDPQYIADKAAERDEQKHRREKEIDAEVADRNSQEFPLDVFFPDNPGVKGKTVKLRPENVAGFLQMANSAANAGEYKFHTITQDGSVHIIRDGPNGTKEKILPNAGTPPGGGGYTDRDKNAAKLRTLQWWKQTYPNGKTSDEFERAVQAHAAAKGMPEDQARREMLTNKKTRGRYGVSKIYIDKPEDDLEFQEKQNQFLESGGSTFGSGKPAAGAPASRTSSGAPRKPRLDPKVASDQVKRYVQMRTIKEGQPGYVNPGAQAEIETSLVQDLIAAGVVTNERDARAYIKRQLGGDVSGGGNGKLSPDVPDESRRQSTQDLLNELVTNKHVKQ